MITRRRTRRLTRELLARRAAESSSSTAQLACSKSPSEAETICQPSTATSQRSSSRLAGKKRSRQGTGSADDDDEDDEGAADLPVVIGGREPYDGVLTLPRHVAMSKIAPRAKERDHQIALVMWLRARNIMAFAPCNGLMKLPAMRVEAARMGMWKGIPDLLIIHRRGKFTGLAIELKRPSAVRRERGTLSAEQVDTIRRLRQQGWYALAVWGFDEAVRIVERYMALPQPDEPSMGPLL